MPSCTTSVPASPNPRSSIAAVSGYGGEQYRLASEQAGFDGHLVKPVSRSAIEALIQGLEAT
ncbi:hypothetical protein CDO81_09845 [Roseateles puraquae]|uniref:Response regulatory domain-containing protein n=1 Tax=Roseateles puraquae TaxID=431059 RepID=A0A254NA25_9BURK|nr:hypothetical protein CDO81_09845 [Roseateles puraquae]